MSDFIYGTTSAAYQVEGGAAEDGRTPSIWDVVAAAPGRIVDASTGAGAIGHRAQWPADLDLLTGLGVAAHRFSISWSRVLPRGGSHPDSTTQPQRPHGRAGSTGLDFYEAIVDGLLERGIQPWATLYHWDLPVELMEDGGWLSRDTAKRFADYAAVVADRLGDRVSAWITMADPFLHMAYGHAAGVDAPGLVLLDRAFPVTHHLLLGHALARDALRAGSPAAKVGIAGHHTTVQPASEETDDRRAALLYDAYHNGQFLAPILRGRYPRLLDRITTADDTVQAGDLAKIAAPLDFYGIDYHHPTVIATATGNPTVPFTVAAQRDLAHTANGWPIRAESLAELLLSLHRQYPAHPPLYVTEAGGSFDDDAEGADRRSDYVESHVAQVHSVVAAGVDVRGYFHRSLTDGWEGSDGYSQHYGLVAVDPRTGRRTPRPAYRTYRDLIARTRPLTPKRPATSDL